MRFYLFMKYCEKAYNLCPPRSRLRIHLITTRDKKHIMQISHDILRYKALIPKMSTVISSGQSDKIVEAALLIMESMFSFSMESALNRHRLNISHLRKLGFHGIPECGLGFSVCLFPSLTRLIDTTNFYFLQRGFQQLNEAIMKIITETLNILLPARPIPQ